MGDAYFTVTDSLVKVSRNTEFSSEYFDKKLNCFFTQKLTTFLNNTNLDSSKSTYVNHNIDDANNYDFTIRYNGKVITKHIYLERFNEYIELTKLMNKLIPEYYHLAYDDDDYLHGKFK